MTEIDAAFQLPDMHDLHLQQAGDETADYLAYQIARLPEDLRSHCRRIMLAYEKGVEDSVYSALLDLFLALGGRGYELRRRMLEGARAHLNQLQYQALRDCLEQGIQRMSHLPVAPTSVLSEGVVGVKRVIKTTEKVAAVQTESVGTESSEELLHQARACLEYSQVEDAQAILEKALQRHSNVAVLHTELLEIYRSTRDKEAFLMMFERIDPNQNPVPDQWEEVANFLIDHD